MWAQKFGCLFVLTAGPHQRGLDPEQGVEIAVLLAQMNCVLKGSGGGGETCAGFAERKDRARPGSGEQSETEPLCA